MQAVLCTHRRKEAKRYIMNGKKAVIYLQQPLVYFSDISENLP